MGELGSPAPAKLAALTTPPAVGACAKAPLAAIRVMANNIVHSINTRFIGDRFPSCFEFASRPSAKGEDVGERTGVPDSSVVALVGQSLCESHRECAAKTALVPG